MLLAAQRRASMGYAARAAPTRSVRYPALAARAGQRGAQMVFATRAASTRSLRCPTVQRLAVIAVPARGFAAPARRGLATTSANNLVPAAL